MYTAKEQAKDEAKRLGLPEDEAMIFAMIDTEMLKAVADGRIDPVAMAREEIACRGLNQQGKWVGFDAAARDMEQGR
jgi:hypothetical protein